MPPHHTLRALLDPRAPKTSVHGLTLPTRVALAWRRTVDRLLPLGGSSEGNQVTLFSDGDSAYDAMLAAIRAARTRVWLETYIFAFDRVGGHFLNELLAARARGVSVILLYDVIGSSGFGAAETQKLVDAGAEVVPFNPPFQFGRRLPLLYRDHRKILIVDDIGFCGGMNISEDYGGSKHGNGLFRDTHVLLEGPGVRDLAFVLAASYQTATGKRLEALPRTAPLAEGVFVQILGSDVRRRKRHIQRALFHTVGRCVRTCFLTSPYFVPPPRLVAALERAARRGVDVRVLTAGYSDVPIVAVAGRHLYARLLKAGVKIYEMMGKTLHAKTASIDGLYAAVGSFNLDRWSFARNLEVNLAAIDPGVARSLEDCFAKDLELSKEIKLDERGLLDRIIGWLAFQLMRL